MIKIDSKITKNQPNFWNNIHFHPTDAIEDDWGRRYLDAVAAAGAAQTVRMYAMLEDIVTMDADGKLCYDFTENDVRMDYMVSKGFKLLVSLNFIPPCIAEYNDKTNTEVRVSTRYKGKTLCTMPPKDWALWEEVCFAYLTHIVERYGLETVKTWYLQCFNEPDVTGFFLAPLGKTPEAQQKRFAEYCKMYKAFESAANRVSRELKIGGPAAASGPVFEYWLNYIKENKLKADFACSHSYGTNPERINSGVKDIGAGNNVEIIKGYLTRLAKYYPDMEFVMDEFGASGAGFCNLIDCPKLIFRENEIFAAFYGQLISRIAEENLPISKLMICLSGSHQPHQLPGKFVEFNGFRSFFTEHFIPKPIFNAYRLGAKLHSGVVEIRQKPENTDILATTDGENYSVMLAYADGGYSEELAPLCETVELPLSGKYRITTYIIDREHVNPYRLWQRENMPDFPDAEQLERLRAEGELRAADSVEVDANGEALVSLKLGCNGLALIEAVKL